MHQRRTDMPTVSTSQATDASGTAGSPHPESWHVRGLEELPSYQQHTSLVGSEELQELKLQNNTLPDTFLDGGSVCVGEQPHGAFASQLHPQMGHK